MTDKEKKNQIVDILLDFYDEYDSNVINRPMIPNIYAGKILDFMQEEPVSEKKCMFTKDNYTDEDRKVFCEDCKEKCEYSKKEEPVSIWHDASEEPEDKANCLIHYIVGGKVTYTDMFPVLYHKDEKEFVSVPYPHTTGYKIEQKSLEGGVVADVYKNMRDRFPLTDISKWAYISDLLNLDNSCNFGKNLQEEPLSDDLEEAAKNHAVERFRTTRDEFLAEKCKWSFKAGAQWQITKLMKDATEAIVHIDAGGYPYIPQIELYDYDKDVPLAKEGDKYKVILIKED